MANSTLNAKTALVAGAADGAGSAIARLLAESGARIALNDVAVEATRVRARKPLGRMAELEEVARVIAFLASEEASYATGAVVPVDGYAAFGGPLDASGAFSPYDRPGPESPVESAPAVLDVPRPVATDGQRL